MPTRQEKVAGHAEHLLDAFLRLRGTYAMLDPLLFDKEVVQEWGSGKRSQGFHIVQSSLLHSCVLDVAKLTLDQDRRTPSLTQLVASLDDRRLVDELRESFAVWNIAPTSGEDPAVLALIQASERREDDKRRQQFDQFVGELKAGWATLQQSPALISFGTMRDKLIAHHELWHDGNRYRALDVSKLGLKFGDVRTVIESIQRLIDLATLIFRNSSFDFEMLDGQLTEAPKTFWSRAS